MIEDVTTCPIWDTPAKPLGIAMIGDERVRVESTRAGGKYCINVVGRAVTEIRKLDDQSKARLTTWLIEQRRLGDECPEVTYAKIEAIMHRPALTVHDRADELLKYIQKKISYIGEEHRFNAGNAPMDMLAYTESVEEDELQYLLRYLFSQDWLELTDDETQTQFMDVSITVKGYGRLAELESVVVASSQAFVAMWFDASLDPAFEEAIEPAIKHAGYTALRMDNTDFLGNIPDKILAEIRRSRFIVADFTQGDEGNCGGVYYEAGFARGLGIPVISTCCKDTIGDVHFDVSQDNHILWETPVELKERLTNRIAAVIGDGPLKAGA